MRPPFFSQHPEFRQTLAPKNSRIITAGRTGGGLRIITDVRSAFRPASELRFLLYLGGHLIYVSSMSAILIAALAIVSSAFVIRELRHAEAANSE